MKTIKQWIIHKWCFRHFDKIFKTFDKMVDEVYKTEKKKNPNVNKDELRLKMWNFLHDTAERKWQWNIILDK